MDTREAKPGDLGGPVIQGLELRDAINGTFKDVDEGTRQVLVEFPHDTVDSYKTMFGNRAFAESFESRLPTMCWQHDLRDPIGRALEAQVTPRVNEIRGQFSDFDRVPNAGRAFSQIEDKTITDFSFGFKNAKFQPTGQRGISRITSAFMAEFSPVTIGSIPGAKAVGLREQGIIIMEMAEILHLRDSGLVTFDGFRSLVEEHHPELLEKIVLTDPGTRAAADKTTPDVADKAKWQALNGGTHHSTGPNGEALRVKPKKGDSGDVTGHSWSVTDDDGNSMGSGSTDGDSADDAKEAAWAALSKKKSGKREVEFTLPENPDDINASFVRSVIEEAFPELGEVLRDAAIDVGPHVSSDKGDQVQGDRAIVSSLASSTDAALDSAMQYLTDVDVSALPDDVQQSLALMQAASVSADALLDAMGIEDHDDTGALGDRGDFSTKPWGDFAESDYSPDQWRSACLITGEGDTKDACHLPVREPDGTLNVHGIAAAAGRLNQTDVSADDKTAAAKALSSLYGQMKKPVPPNVLQLSGAGSRSDEEIIAEQKVLSDAALAKLDGRLARRTPATV